VHAEAIRKFNQHDQRYTSQRRLIVTVLAAADRPLIIQQLIKRASSTKKVLAQSSLYRNLVVLENVGVVQRVFSTDEIARYELNDEILGHHHHLVCSKCGEVLDVRIPEELELSLDAALLQIAKRSGFKLDQHRLDLIGRCSKCS
jgi:Fur family ferric uptake transcriptional regulator